MPKPNDVLIADSPSLTRETDRRSKQNAPAKLPKKKTKKKARKA